MMRCKQILEQLWDFVDGELAPVDEAAIRRHLEVCNQCYPQFDFRRAHIEFMRHLRGHQSAPPALRRALFQRILLEEAGTSEDG